MKCVCILCVRLGYLHTCQTSLFVHTTCFPYVLTRVFRKMEVASKIVQNEEGRSGFSMDKILDDQYEQNDNGGGTGRNMPRSSSKLDDEMKQLIEKAAEGYAKRIHDEEK